MPDRTHAVPTQVGPARVRLSGDGSRGLLCLGHGAGGGVDAPDLVATASACREQGWRVALVEQPYRVAGRRVPDRAPRLDAAWVDVVRWLLSRSPDGSRRPPLVVGGRSSGGRVACRTAEELAATAVVCLAFPLSPPRPRRTGPAPSRLGELVAVPVPCLVVQGSRDPFGSAERLAAQAGAGIEVVEVPGDHSLRRSATEAGEAVAAWLAQRVA